MRIEITFIGGHTWTTDSDDTIHTVPDRVLSDDLFYADVRLAEHLEIDCQGGGEYDCPRCSRDRKAFADVAEEYERRARMGIDQIVDLDAPTLEERWAPYGEEWELEQRERHGGGW